ncbi:MAG: CheR family methyltransferase [Longimicrobiales bacterium]
MLATRWWRAFRYRLVVATARRASTDCTNFLRVRTQFEVLVDAVLTHLAPAGLTRDLEIVVLGCSTGAEPYSIASVLTRYRPDLRFHVRAADIDAALIARARRARYQSHEVLDCWAVDDDFVMHTFQREADAFVVKPEIARHVSFEVADLLDPGLVQRFGRADVVFAQNVLFHFPRRQARFAFQQLCALLRGPGALFIAGMDLDLRVRLTRKHGLLPLEHRVREIHEDARVLRGRFWPWYYWGLEEYQPNRRDHVHRYATIFLKQP